MIWSVRRPWLVAALVVIVVMAAALTVALGVRAAECGRHPVRAVRRRLPRPARPTVDRLG